MLIDFDLCTNEVLVFDNEQCVFIEKGKLRDNLKINLASNTGRPDFAPTVDSKETYGNTLRAKIAQRGGGVLSPTRVIVASS